MDLTWSAPLDDGGSPLTGYQLEARLNGGEWQLWELLPPSETTANLQMLIPNTEYQFRVRAANKAGKSDPSHPSAAKAAKPKSRKCSLARPRRS